MKFGRSIPLLLFFVFILPTFINAAPKNCALDGHCYPYVVENGGGRDLVVQGEKTCDDGICYAFRCMTYYGRVMHGSGCYEDFVNTCKYIDPKIKEKAKGDKHYVGVAENVFVTSCDETSSCAQTQEKQWFGERAGSIFGKRFNESAYQVKCLYDSIPEETKPKVQCRQRGKCTTGKTFGKESTKNYSTVECSECVLFFCGDDERLMAGEGCLEDFERICKNVPADDMQKIKTNSKNYFSSDENYMMLSCSYADNCQGEEVYKYKMSMPDKFDMFKKWLTKPDKICKYEVSSFCGDDERLMAGEGCLEDFERICKNVPADDMKKIKANRKNYFYSDENYMMASCSYKDNCHEEEHKKYLNSIPDKFEMFNKWLFTKPDKVCKYEPLPEPEPSKQNGNGSSKSEPLKQDENGNDANGIKISGMFIFGFILYYLL